MTKPHSDGVRTVVGVKHTGNGSTVGCETSDRIRSFRSIHHVLLHKNGILGVSTCGRRLHGTMNERQHENNGQGLTDLLLL